MRSAAAPNCTDLGSAAPAQALPTASEGREQGCEGGGEEEADSKRIGRAPSARPATEHDRNSAETREANGNLGDQRKGFDENLRNAA